MRHAEAFAQPWGSRLPNDYDDADDDDDGNEDGDDDDNGDDDDIANEILIVVSLCHIGFEW